MKLNAVYKGILLSALTIPATAFGQANESTETVIDCELEANQNNPTCVDATSGAPLEEIVVTGTYLNRDEFTSPSPIDVITLDDIEESGAATIGEYIRDASYSLNAQTLNAGGGNGADTVLNLRGFGTDGTITLVNGVRATTSLDGNSLIPSIALQRAEVLLDGGGAIYGADAIAGVVNLISMRRYEGVKINTKYNSDLGDYEDADLGILAGKSFDFLNLDVVQSFETQKRTTLSNTERPQYLRAAVEVSEAGNPGTFDTAAIDNNGIHPNVIDPNCGFNVFDGTAQMDAGKSGYASAGLPFDEDGRLVSNYDDIDTCRFAVGEQDDYLPALERYVSNTNLRMDLTDKIELNYSLAMSYRTVEDPEAYTTGESNELFLPADHPALAGVPEFQNAVNVFGMPTSQFAVRNWRPFGKLGAKPSGYNSDGTFDVTTETRQYNHTVTLDYQFADTSWTGQTYGSTSSRTVAISQQVLRTSRLAAAFQGLGGPDCGFDTDQLVGFENATDSFGRPTQTVAQQTLPIIQSASQTPGENGCQYFNPLISSALDPSLANSPELLDWLHDDVRWTDQRTETRTWETRASGEVFDLPAGPVQLVLGYNFREVDYATMDSGAEAIDDDFDGLGGGFLFREIVQSPFMEVGVPILHNLSFSAAVRKEEYKDRTFGSATIPKYSVSYQPVEDLALRASFGESFTAPTGQELNENDARQYNGLTLLIADPFDDAQAFGNSSDVPKGNGIPRPTGTYTFTGNQDLEPETSESTNIGFTYRGLENWQFSADFQQIKYFNRIVNIEIGESLSKLAAQFEAQGGDYSNGAEVIAFLNANPTANNVRDPGTGGIIESVRRPFNASDTIIARFADFKVRYNMDTRFGYFSTELSGTTYDKYMYIPEASITGEYEDAVGQRNEINSASVAMPRWKSDFTLRWSRDNHRIVSRTKYVDGVEFDGDDLAAFAPQPDKISSFTTTDLRYSYNFNQLFGGSANVTIGASNIFNREAQILPVRGGIESELHDPYGRRVFIEGNYEF